MTVFELIRSYFSPFSVGSFFFFGSFDSFVVTSLLPMQLGCTAPIASMCKWEKNKRERRGGGIS